MPTPAHTHRHTHVVGGGRSLTCFPFFCDLCCQSLKHYTMAEGFFTGYREDMYDFHNYALRNVTINSYLEVRA